MKAYFMKVYTFLLSIVMAFLNLFNFGVKPQTKDAANVIFFIGDGMGINSIEKTISENNVELIFDSFPVKSFSRTASANSSVTDSAAGATALACGVRTKNGCVAVYPSDTVPTYSYPVSLTELAKSKGMSAGVVTTDKTYGATPAGFSAHTSSRNNSKEITEQQLAGNLDLVWGVKTSRAPKSKVEAAGFTYVNDYASMNSLPEGSRSFGQFEDKLWRKDAGNMPTLTQMTVKAIDLLDDNENGFFLMVEGAHIDKHSHNNKGEEMKEAMISFDSAVRAALDYAKKDGNTLVVITADHETGGIKKVGDEYKYTTGGHTGADVPIFVYGSDSFIAEGETAILNTEIPKRIAAFLSAEEFPLTAEIAPALDEAA